MHTFHHEQSGIRFHFNTDLSGPVVIADLLPSRPGRLTGEVQLRGDAVAAFARHLVEQFPGALTPADSGAYPTSTTAP